MYAQVTTGKEYEHSQGQPLETAMYSELVKSMGSKLDNPSSNSSLATNLFV